MKKMTDKQFFVCVRVCVCVCVCVFYSNNFGIKQEGAISQYHVHKWQVVHAI